jgi:hypothetical protein
MEIISYFVIPNFVRDPFFNTEFEVTQTIKNNRFCHSEQLVPTCSDSSEALGKVKNLVFIDF